MPTLARAAIVHIPLARARRPQPLKEKGEVISLRPPPPRRHHAYYERASPRLSRCPGPNHLLRLFFLFDMGLFTFSEAKGKARQPSFPADSTVRAAGSSV